VIGGYQPAGQIDGDPVDIEDLFSGGVEESFGRFGKHRVDDIVPQAIRGPGVCQGMATANTMHCVVEALGMCVAGSAPVRANSEKMFAKARETGARIVQMVHEGLKPRDIMTVGAFRNAAAMVLGVSGSINAIKHLQATAVEAGMDLDVYGLWNEVGRDVPVLSAVRPNGTVRIEQFEDAGGARAMLKQLESLLDLDVIVASGKTMGQDIADAGVVDQEIIRPLDRAISPGPAIAILKGTLAPESAVVKLGIRDGSRPETFRGPARVFDDNEAALKALADGEGRKGDVLVVRGQGLKAGPAMGGGASYILFAINAAGLAKDVAFVTDGQLSGLCLKGLTVAEVAPEGCSGGPIGKVRDGDMIAIDVAAHSIDLEVPADELASRQAAGALVPAGGWLGMYRRDVQDMATGGVLIDRG